MATSYHILEAVTGIFPDFSINYLKVLVTKGELLGLQEPIATPQTGAQIAFAWEDNSGQGLAKSDDQLLVVVYNEARGLYETREQAEDRSTGAYTLQLPDNWTTDTVQCWVAFTSAEGKKCSTSVYMEGIVLI
jgi:hypothetical protein